MPRLCGLFVLLLLFACSEQALKSPVQDSDQTKSGQVGVYECGDYEFVTYTSADEVALYLADGYRVLKQVGAASGSKYSDSEMTFWSRGNSAMLDLGYRKFSDCQLNRGRIAWEEARRRGIDFRAVGQEPGWYLEISQGRTMLFVAAYGSQRVLLATPEPELTEAGESYQIEDDSHQLLVEISFEHCADIMSGEIFDNAVEVTLDGRLYHGCGLALASWWDQPNY
jgi:membrane-bound inhibitor of C-type lysozyme/uncharacterized membrane protein